MKGTLLVELLHPTKGVQKRMVQPFRSFTQSFLGLLYTAQSREMMSDWAFGGFNYHGLYYQLFYTFTNYVDKYNRAWGSLVGGPKDSLGRKLFTTYISTTQLVAYHPPLEGILCGEGNTPVSAYDNCLEFPIGLSVPAMKRGVLFGSTSAADSAWAENGAEMLSISDSVTPNRIERYDAVTGASLGQIVTDQTGTSNAYWWAFALGGYLYVSRTLGMLHKIDLATGLTVLSRDVSGDGLGGTAFAGYYDSVAGDIVGIRDGINRWSIVDFTPTVAYVGLDRLNPNYRAATGIFNATRLDANHAFLFVNANEPTTGYYFWGILDLVTGNLDQMVNPALETLAEQYNTQGGFFSLGDNWYKIMSMSGALWYETLVNFDRRRVVYHPTRILMPEITAVDGYFDIVGTMENLSGAAITVAEVGMHTPSGRALYPLISRDVLAVPVVVPDGQLLRTTIRLSASI